MPPLPSGLLLLNGSKVIGKQSVQAALKHLSSFPYYKCYIHIDYATTGQLSSNDRGQYVSLMTELYKQSSTIIPSTNILVLHRYSSLEPISLPVCRLHTASSESKNLERLFNLDQNIERVKYDTVEDDSELQYEQLDSYKNTALGGTFDCIHVGHKVLLTSAIALTQKSLTIGVTGESMNGNKKLKELIAPITDRLQHVREFVTDISPHIVYKILEIHNPYGPTITEPDLQCIIVSEETRRGGEAVNQKRKEMGWNELIQYCIPVIDDPDSAQDQDLKISSSNIRENQLGVLRRDLQDRDIPRRPYLIGLTGGIASGKSSVCKRLEKLGAGVVNSDLIAHKSYDPGSEAYMKIIETFGSDIVDKNTGEIARRKLGELVFNDQSKLNALNGVVWPATEKLVRKEIEKLYREKNKDIIFIEAALLLEASWQNKLHEVWSCVIPEDEAHQRVMDRGLNSVEAEKRLKSQSSNRFRVQLSDVILSTRWDPTVTQKQVEKAWNLLQSRVNCKT